MQISCALPKTVKTKDIILHVEFLALRFNQWASLGFKADSLWSEGNVISSSAVGKIPCSFTFS